MHCWFDPNKTKTLFDVSWCIATFIQDESDERTNQSCAVCCGDKYSVNKMFIQGVTYDINAMAAKSTLDGLQDKQPFNLTYIPLMTCVIL